MDCLEEIVGRNINVKDPSGEIKRKDSMLLETGGNP
jgi:hypothetical protein